ncbi:MAG TPA: shikimate kinase [Candidatus Agrococcus pullicola]|uniref:Shikimate kinase n=1 Tax=Candidatus Agrococcus pullicola TaxID=2838429 RepID=A0A9D2CAP0_9MICO|nr:shikimate kinase [Candidatus Agrococcus pullicola]
MSAQAPRPVVLIGPMAAGKSSVGRMLAKVLAREFIDTDKVIVRHNGPIPEIFAAQGERGFRELEASVIAEALRPGTVVSLGGGAVLHEGTRARIADATVVLITVSESAVERRIDNNKRPLLAEEGIVAWRRITAEREPLYRQLADAVADTSHRPMRRVAEEIAAWVLEHEHPGSGKTKERGVISV